MKQAGTLIFGDGTRADQSRSLIDPEEIAMVFHENGETKVTLKGNSLIHNFADPDRQLIDILTKYAMGQSVAFKP